MTTISEAVRNDRMTSQHIIPLDFASISEVPKSHIWSQTNEPHQNIQPNNYQDSLIPVIDLSDPNAKDLIGQACKTWGMFQVINHGVPLELVKEVDYEARRLFSLPTHDKLKVLRSTDGATGYGSIPITPYYDKCMWHEGFTIIGSCVEDAKVLWPHAYQSFCDKMDSYQHQMKLLSNNLLHIILQKLDVTQEEMNWATGESQCVLQLNSYPPCPDPSQVVGIAPHTDSLLLTLLYQGGVNGLEIFVEGLGWCTVQPIEGAFVVNLGDLLHIFSNAKFPVVSHRAMVKQPNQRISLAFFHGPSVDSMVAPASMFQKPYFKSLLVKEYLGLKIKEFTKALSLIRI